MRNQIKENSKVQANHRIKVQLDHKTFIVISHLSSLKVWRKRYPHAKVLMSA